MFIAFEGPEGAGKSTLIARLSHQLGAVAVVTREPGSGEFGQAVRKLLLEGSDLPPWSELFLFLADRANHVEAVVRPALNAGKTVLCDRFADSTVVYQGHARGLDLEFLREANRKATGGLVPELTVLLDLDPEVGLARQTRKDRLDRESIEFHHKVRNGFLAEMALAPGRWLKVDAAQTPEAVFQEVWAALQARA